MFRICICLIFLFSSQISAHTIRLKPHVIQKGVVLTLGNVASIDGKGDLGGLLRRIELPNKGLVGDSVVYDQMEVTRIIEQANLDGLGAVKILGPQRVEVSRVGRRLHPSEYLDVARRKLTECVARGDKNYEAELYNEGRYDEIAIPEGSVEIRARSCSGHISQRYGIGIDVVVDDVLYTSRTVVFDIYRQSMATYLRKNERRGFKLTASSIETRLTRIGIGSEDVFIGLADIEGKRLRKDHSSDQPITWHDVEEIPTVSFGDHLNAAATVGRVQVAVKVVAEGTGDMGDVIWVRDRRNGVRLRVEIVDKKNANIIDAN